MERRVRSWWVERQRYRRVGWLAGALGILLAALPVAWSLQVVGSSALASTGYLATAVLMLAVGFLLPYWLVRVLWRRRRMHHLGNWG